MHHSGVVLQGLSFQPSGAIVAAATTSLPEGIGGERNWDYRYSWVRDASFTMEALWVAACPDEAERLLRLPGHRRGVLGRARTTGCRSCSASAASTTSPSATLPHLEGWRDSAPVRVGNGAWDQSQIDVYGELLGAAHRLADQLDGIDDDTRRFLIACADAAAAHWTREGPGHLGGARRPAALPLLQGDVLGRAGPGHRAGRPARRERPGRRVEARSASEIWETVVRDGWNEQAGAFTQYVGSTALDASNLMMAIVGFLPADDPRMLATIDAIEQRLTDDRGLVYRYRTEDGVDGLAGEEGTFLLCTFWLAQALAMSGQVDRARAVFERAVAFVNDVGLLAEEVDAETGELLGNFPQAFSHIGLVNAAWAISQAERRAAGER